MEKYIIFAGRKVPIATSYDVIIYDNENNQSFYDPQRTLSADQVMKMQLVRPEMRAFSKRAGLDLEPSQLFNVPKDQVYLLGERLTQIAFHHDVTEKATDTFNVLCTRGLSTHFDINYDGRLYQFMDPYHVAWATGDNNSKSIAIDMNNPVFPELQATEPAAGLREIYQGKINGSVKTMLGYTEAQYETLIALLKALLLPMEWPGEGQWIPMKTVSENCFPPITESGEIINRLLKDPIGFVGMLGHYHCSINKWDPGPAFDWMRVLAGIKGERNSFPVIIDRDGRNLSSVAGNALINALDNYYQNTQDSEGGWFPIGVNQSWHSGVHVAAEEGTPVRAMMNGTIVAVRNVNRVDLGDPSFVLIRHERVETGHDGKNVSIYWYSLYMHLKHYETPESMNEIPWITNLFGGTIDTPEDLIYAPSSGKFPPEKGIPNTFNTISAKGPNEIAKAFYRGDILLVNIPVKAGDEIGFVGIFGDTTDRDRQRAQVHVEVFSETNIFQTRNAQKDSWNIVEGDSSDYSLVRVKRIISPIQKHIAEHNNGKKPSFLKASEIRSFFSAGPTEDAAAARDSFRKFICYHKSEWSPLMDWTRTAVQTVGWQWENENQFGDWLLKWLPFQWLTKDVTSALNLPASHHFYTYHPIYLLEHLNSTYAGNIRKNAEESSPDEADKKREEQQAKIDRLLELNKKAALNGSLSDEESKERDALYAQMDDHLGDQRGDIDFPTEYNYQHDKFFDDWDEGEWPPPGK